MDRRRYGRRSRQRWQPSGDATGTSRANAMTWARRLASDPRTVYLDTETTGLDHRAEIVEIAVVGADGEVLFETMIRPHVPIPADASAIHGIVDADVASAPTWCEMYDPLARVLHDRPVVVYNAEFDYRMVRQCCDRHGFPPPPPRWECAMRAYAAFQAGAFARRRGPRLQKLETAVSAFGAAPGGHRAAGDARACRAVVLGMAAVDQPDG